jgi:hypothetical protein
MGNDSAHTNWIGMIRLACLLLLVLGAAPALAVELPRHKIVLPSAISVDAQANTVVLPLHRGRAGDRTVWYVLTDSSDSGDATRRGLVHAPLLAHAGHVQTVTQKSGELVFAAAPDFRPQRLVVAGPTGYPPQSAVAGATAPPAYSPLIRIDGQATILNAPVVAVGAGPFDLAGHSDVADRVLAIDIAKRTVTLQLSHGFAEGRRVVYISTEASDPGVAALERAIHVPRLSEGNGDIGLLVVVNGQGGGSNAEAQGLQQFLRDGQADAIATLSGVAGLGSPQNILTAFPAGRTASGYSPLWAVTKVVWRDNPGPALRHQADVYALAKTGAVDGGNGQPLQPAGVVVNCPVIAWLDDPVP